MVVVNDVPNEDDADWSPLLVALVTCERVSTSLVGGMYIGLVDVADKLGAGEEGLYRPKKNPSPDS